MRMIEDSAAREVITALLSKNAQHRAIFQQLKNFAFFKTINWEALARKEIHPWFIPQSSDSEDSLTNFDEEITRLRPIDDIAMPIGLLFVDFEFISPDLC
jgi:hypothetical protein